MAYWTIPVRNHEGDGSCSDDQHHEQAGKWNNLSEANRMLRTNSHLKAKRREVTDRTNRAVGVPDKIQPDYEDLFKAYDKLQREHRALITKQKSTMQLVEKLKGEIQTLKLRCAVPRRSITCSNPTRRKPIVDRENGANEHNYMESVQTALGQMQLRLSSAETQLQNIRREEGVSRTKMRLTLIHFIRSHSGLTFKF